MPSSSSSSSFLHCVLRLAMYCNRSCPFACVFVCVCVCLFVCSWVCYHDNSKHWILAVLYPREGGLRRGEFLWLRLTTASAQCLRLSERFFSLFAEMMSQYTGDSTMIRSVSKKYQAHTSTDCSLIYSCGLHSFRKVFFFNDLHMQSRWSVA